MHFGTHTDLSDCVAYCIFREVFGIVLLFFSKKLLYCSTQAMVFLIPEHFNALLWSYSHLCTHYPNMCALLWLSEKCSNSTKKLNSRKVVKVNSSGEKNYIPTTRPLWSLYMLIKWKVVRT